VHDLELENLLQLVVMASEDAAAPDLYDVYAQMGFGGFMRHMDYLRVEMVDLLDSNFWIDHSEEFLHACFANSMQEAQSYYQVIDRISLFPEVDADQVDAMLDSLDLLVEDLHHAWEQFVATRMPNNEE